MSGWLTKFASGFYQNIIYADRWLQLLNGLKVTIIITLAAIVIGTLLGFILAFMKMAKGGFLAKILNIIANVYIEIIRGTPTVVQLLIIYFVVFSSVNVSKTFAAIIAFGLNSAAYVAEIVRAGVQGVDNGQVEAGRSLGLSKWQTTHKIVLPQAIKNIIPTYTSEFIVLLKETAIVGYIGLEDLTKVSDVIKSRTYSAFFPLLTAAVVYFTITFSLSKIFASIERRLRKSDIR